MSAGKVVISWRYLMIHSAIEQGNSIIVLDSKYPSLSIADYAQSQGYDVHVFAPGFSESDICNPLDFLIDSQDAETARFLATSINRYFWQLDNDNSFFGVAGEQLTGALLMLAKEFGTHADILTAAAIVKSENIIQRLINADLTPWIKVAFSQIFSCADSQKTAASIVSSVRMMFSDFIDVNISWLIGKSTLPLEITDRQMIILGITTEPHQAVNPLIWSIFELFLNRHIDSNLIVACDEESFHHLSKHNYLNPRSLWSQQDNGSCFPPASFDKTISIDLELAKRIEEVEQKFPLIKI